MRTFDSFIQTISRTGSARSGVLSRPHTSLSTNKLDVIEDASNGDELNDDGYDTDLEVEGNHKLYCVISSLCCIFFRYSL